MDSNVESELTDDMCANAEYTDIGVNLWREDEDSVRAKIKEMPWGDYFELVRPIHSMHDGAFKHYVSCGMKVDLLRALYYASMREPLIAVWPGRVYPAFAPNMPVFKSDPKFRYVYAEVYNSRLVSTMLRTCIHAHASSHDTKSKHGGFRPLIALIDRQHPDEVIEGAYSLRTYAPGEIGIGVTRFVAVAEGVPVLVAHATINGRGLVTQRTSTGLPVQLGLRNGNKTQIHTAVYPQIWALIGAVTVATRRKLIVHCGRDVLLMIIRMYLHAMQNLDRIVPDSL